MFNFWGFTKFFFPSYMSISYKCTTICILHSKVTLASSNSFLTCIQSAYNTRMLQAIWIQDTQNKHYFCTISLRKNYAYLLCAQEFRQIMHLCFNFDVCALDASKSYQVCIILSKFTRKNKYALINLQILRPIFWPYRLKVTALKPNRQSSR